MDYSRYYDLESYLFQEVSPRFAEGGVLEAFDFFSIIAWKANRAKSAVARRLLRRGHGSVETAVRALTRDIASRPNAMERMRLLYEWGFRLPMASAILAVLYPDEFTVYDTRACGLLARFQHLANISDFERLWAGYLDFKDAVCEAAPANLKLRDKDGFLWGKSFHEQLSSDIRSSFGEEH